MNVLSPMPNNRHLSVDAEGNVTSMDLEFVEEPLGLTKHQMQGFPRIVTGDLLGPDTRYEVLRNLGWGLNSSVWLARDHSSISRNRFVSIKALKGYATELDKLGISRELEINQPLPDAEGSRCLKFIDYFVMPGKVASDGEHLCIVTELMGGNLKALQRSFPSEQQCLPFPLAKRILRHVLEGLVQIHRLGIAHTDLKHDNVMYDVDPGLDISSELARDPPRLNPPEHSLGIVQTAVSQPLPLPSSLADCMSRNFYIGDFGSASIAAGKNGHPGRPLAAPLPCAGNTLWGLRHCEHLAGACGTRRRARSPIPQFVDKIVTDNITPKTLRAPETILNGPWNQKVDIWTFGCLIFELVVNRELFEFKPYPNRGLDATAGHLYQMICFTGDVGFTPKQLSLSNRALEYFEPSTCYLKSEPPFISSPFDKMLRNYKVLAESDVQATSALMQRCMCLDPDDRPSAEELLDDPFWVGSEDTIVASLATSFVDPPTARLSKTAGHRRG